MLGIGICCGVSAHGVGYQHMVWVSTYGVGYRHMVWGFVIWCGVSECGVG